MELLGRKITLVSDAPETKVQEIVEAVNARMKVTQRTVARASAEQVAILTALNMAEELIDAERRLRAIKDGVRSRTRWLLEAIDNLAMETRDPRAATRAGEAAGPTGTSAAAATAATTTAATAKTKATSGRPGHAS